MAVKQRLSNAARVFASMDALTFESWVCSHDMEDGPTIGEIRFIKTEHDKVVLDSPELKVQLSNPEKEYQP